MAANDRMLLYFYWSELDKAGHASGSPPSGGSTSWRNSMRP